MSCQNSDTFTQPCQTYDTSTEIYVSHTVLMMSVESKSSKCTADDAKQLELSILHSVTFIIKYKGGILLTLNVLHNNVLLCRQRTSKQKQCFIVTNSLNNVKPVHVMQWDCVTNI